MASRFAEFVQGLRDNLNDSIGPADAVSMLAQHLITKPVFDALFSGHDFASHNPVSRVMQGMVDALSGNGLDAETNRLDTFYASVRVRAAEVSSAEGKQQVIAELYERFFKIGFAKQADALGIVYTPVQIVDFILRAADQASRDAFGRGLTDEGVHVLDGFTGTGTFMTRLLQSGLVRPEDLARKYAGELHANEIMLLAYYIAAVNIESTYHALTDSAEYEPFPGICLADTFQISEVDDGLDLHVFPANNDRIARQLEMPINVIVGNPPYSVGQGSANDLNANLKYPTLDGRIADTYARLSTAANKNSLYDSYLRAFRWATDRIGPQGVVAFVANGGWIDGNTADGIRLSLAGDYSRIYVYNLRGNQRTAGELSRKEGGKVFGGGSRNTIAIWIGVKDPSHAGPCDVHYKDIGDYLSREEKLDAVDTADLHSLDWTTLTPNQHGDWLGQRDERFGTWPAIGDKQGDGLTIFDEYSRGLATGRDAWCYSFSASSLHVQVDSMIQQYQSALTRFNEYAQRNGITAPRESDVSRFIDQSPDLTSTGAMSWNRSIKQQIAKSAPLNSHTSGVRTSLYRPFCSEHVYFDRQLNDMLYRLPAIFPTRVHDNVGIILTSPGGNASFTCNMTKMIPDLVSVTGAGNAAQFFPRWTWQPVETENGALDFGSPDAGEVVEGYRRVDNITDEIAAMFAAELGGPVTKDDLFHVVYAQLHDPGYRSRYAADLKKMLPHVPPPSSRERFDRLADWGRQLAELHVGYESVKPYPLTVELKAGADASDRETWRVSKMKWKSKADHSAIVYNPKVVVSGIPAEAERYLLGSRTALGWLLDRYQVKTDKASGIVNDPNDWADEHDDPRYIVDLIAKVTRVAVETVAIVDLIADNSDFAPPSPS